MHLGALVGQAQAQLEGFKSRALRAHAPMTQRHLYMTEWRAVDMARGAGAVVLVAGDESSDCERLGACPVLAVCGDEWLGCERPEARILDEGVTRALRDGVRATIMAVAATQRGCLALLPLFALQVALTLVQAQAAEMLTVQLLALDTYAAHAGGWGLARSARAEALLPLACIDAPFHSAVVHSSSLAEPEAMLHQRSVCAPRLQTARISSAGLVRLHLHARGAISNLFVAPQPALQEGDDL